MRTETGRSVRLGIVTAVVALGLACFSPSDRRPGTRLTGESAEAFPSDWSFSNAHKEIALQVRTPYLVPHSVTIWCAALDGALYVGARNPDEKRWPGWVERDPEVRLRVGTQVYEARLDRIDDADRIARIRAAYAVKYALKPPAEGAAPPMRYWKVEPRG